MGKVMTVLGEVDSSELGIVLPHEHLLMDVRKIFSTSTASTPSLAMVDQESPLTPEYRWAVNRDPRALRDNLVLDDPLLAVQELKHYKNSGGGCLVEVTPYGARGPDHGNQLRWISEQTGVHIIAGCGFYSGNFNQRTGLPNNIQNASISDLKDYILTDLTKGINGSEAKAGVIGEIGTINIDEVEENVLRACGQSYKETGVPITIHTSYGCFEALRIIDILTSEGVPTDAIIMGHMDENLVALDPEPRLMMDYQLDVASTGVWVQYDTFGSEWYYDIDGILEPRDTERIAGIVKLIETGYENQLLLSLDIWTKHCLRKYGGWGYDHLIRSVVPMMKRASITKDQIHKMMVVNPARALSIHESP